MEEWKRPLQRSDSWTGLHINRDEPFRGRILTTMLIEEVEEVEQKE
jgi:hypothetical protein